MSYSCACAHPTAGMGIVAQLIAYGVDAGAQIASKTASVAAGEAKKGERAAKRQEQAARLTLQAERQATASAREAARLRAAATRASAQANIEAQEKQQKLIYAGAAVLGVATLATIIFWR